MLATVDHGLVFETKLLGDADSVQRAGRAKLPESGLIGAALLRETDGAPVQPRGSGWWWVPRHLARPAVGWSGLGGGSDPDEFVVDELVVGTNVDNGLVLGRAPCRETDAGLAKNE